MFGVFLRERSLPILAIIIAALPSAELAGQEEGRIERIEEVVVTASLHSEGKYLAMPFNVLADGKLRMKSASNLGAMLRGELGVHARGYGPNVGVPIIRAHSENRVGFLRNGVQVVDVSGMGQDHALAIEPLLAERVEIIRGPATLRYSSGAIGGVVNVLDGRQSSEPLKRWRGAAEVRHATAADENAVVFALSAPTSRGDVRWHFDGLYRENGDVEIKGFALAEDPHEDEHGADEDEHEEGRAGVIENTAGLAKNVAGGATWFGERSRIGFSVEYLDNRYGLPAGLHAHADDEAAGGPHGEEEEGAHAEIVMEKFGVDLHGALQNPLGYEDSELRYILRVVDYEHGEEEEGVSLTEYDNESREFRLEFFDRLEEEHGKYMRLSGIHLVDRDVGAEGQETYFPSVGADMFALFYVAELFHQEDWTLKAGARGEWWRRDPERVRGGICGAYGKRSFDLFGFSMEMTRGAQEHGRLKLSVSHNQRAPVAPELFACGLHVAINSYQQGDADLEEEEVAHLGLGWHWDDGDWDFEVSGHYEWYADYIYWELQEGEYRPGGTGFAACPTEHEDCRPLYRTFQRDALFRGYEWRLTRHFSGSLGTFAVGAFGDGVYGRLEHGVAEQDREIPRIPARRHGVQVDWERNAWSAWLQWTKVDEQSRPGANEFSTQGHEELDAALLWRRPLDERFALEVQLRGSNLLDEEIRDAANFVRQAVPEAGRSVSLSLRLRGI